MSEWWTYRPSDFLMFAPETYWRQIELHNDALWPFQLLPVFALLVLVVMALVPGHSGRREAALRWGLTGLALCWAFVAWSFLWQRYAPINWAAQVFALGFAVQALVLLGLASHPTLRVTSRSGRRVPALTLLAWAALAHPWLAPAFGRPMSQAELLGTAPDPTALATLGWLLLTEAQSRSGRVLLWTAQAVALAWCGTSGATLWTMGETQGWVPMVAAMLTLIVLWRWPGARPDRPAE